MTSLYCKKKILITGGAGYIGSHISIFLAEKGYNIIILDTLNHNQVLPNQFKIKQNLDKNIFNTFEKQISGQIVVLKKDFADEQTLKQIFEQQDIEAVIHCAALIEVGESVKNPLSFYNNNVIKTIKLLETMIKYNVKKIIFSSSCAVYGNPKKLPLTENHSKNPVSPYGNNKYIIEMILKDFQKAYELEFVSLRYFNAAGAEPTWNIGEQHDPESHLIPLLLRATYEKKPFYIFGNNYNTKDGSCIRDFLHVFDLAQAHWLALNHIFNTHSSDFFNLGTGNGYSVKECIHMVEKITKLPIKTIIKEQRAGDPPILIADPSKAYNILQWKPQYSNLEHIIKTANMFYKLNILNKKTEISPKSLQSEIST